MTLLMAAVVTVALQIVVRTYDSAGVPAAETDRARAGVGAILASVGVEPIWRPCGAVEPGHAGSGGPDGRPGSEANETICGGPVKPHEVAVRIVTSGSRSPKGVLGFSVVDTSSHAGSLATIYEDRVRALAAESGTDTGQLLGRAIAHEIGHLLLGASHQRHGLMRALWLGAELRRGSPADWSFTEQEGTELRRRLTARTRAHALRALTPPGCGVENAG